MTSMFLSLREFHSFINLFLILAGSILSVKHIQEKEPIFSFWENTHLRSSKFPRRAERIPSPKQESQRACSGVVKEKLLSRVKSGFGGENRP